MARITDIGLDAMAFFKSVAVIVISAVATVSGPGMSFAQDLSEASLASSTDLPSGYMSLGGHLGRAIVKPVHVKKAVAHFRPQVRKNRNTPTPVFNRTTAYSRDVTPRYLVSMSLDQTGLNIAALSR
ncbi:hypothetical protein [Hyphomicrobium sp. 2TAF46]|uniref:hypothetical protein n=1 Tax=Hyphomicrobium sp. 2TAF46 TaxID=3233019 RepID=UPI003F93847A